MHTIFITRGIQQQVDLWKMFMQTQLFPFKQKPILKDEKTGEWKKDDKGNYVYGPERITMVQGALRPIQLWEYVYPKECHADFLAMMHAVNEENSINPNLRPLAWVLRKAMKLKPIEYPEQFKGKKPEEILGRYIPNEAVAVSMIGQKDDITKDFLFGNEAYYQEGL